VETNIITDSTALVTGTDFIIECQFDPPNNIHRITVNGVTAVSGPASNTTPPNAFGISYPGAAIFGVLDPGNPPDIDGFYSELLVQNSVPPIPETTKRRRYLANRYNITIP